MIYYFVPYSTEKNLGEYYNNCMALIPEGSWGCFVDGDAMFTTPDFGHHIEQTIKDNPQYSLFTCVTNRVGTSYQCILNTWNKEEMTFHRQMGKELKELYGTKVRDITDKAPLSGVLMLINKKDWFYSDRFKEQGLLGVDNSIHYAMQKAGKKVGLMMGTYVQHYYRGGNIQDKSHLM